MRREKNLAFLILAYKIYDWSHILSWYSVIWYLGVMLDSFLLRLLAIWLATFIYLVFGSMPWSSFSKEYAVHRCLRHGETFKENEKPLYEVEYRYYHDQRLKHWYQKLIHPIPLALPFVGALVVIARYSKVAAMIIGITVTVVAALLLAGMLIAIAIWRAQRRGMDEQKIPIIRRDDGQAVMETISRATKWKIYC